MLWYIQPRSHQQTAPYCTRHAVTLVMIHPVTLVMIPPVALVIIHPVILVTSTLKRGSSLLSLPMHTVLWRNHVALVTHESVTLRFLAVKSDLVVNASVSDWPQHCNIGSLQ